MAKYKDFCGFRFGNVHTSDLHLIVVSSSKRYEKNLLPDPSDVTTSIPGGDGSYYFGSTFKEKEFNINVAFNEVSEPDFRKIANAFATDELQDLIFDELPYKTFKAKLKSKPEFKFVCFTDKYTGERVYKGEGTLKFVCYFPYAFCFNKYVVRTADYYRCTPPEKIIDKSIERNPYKTKPIQKQLSGLIKNHYNKIDNMNTPWAGGYPTIEQVQKGELFFKDPINQDKKLIIDVRGYWDNIPEWQSTAKLLTTPTLDFNQELIYLPQYNRYNYINMDTGLNQEQGLIGSRILVYNPGDLPVDFELKLGKLAKRFRANDGDYRFRISRYNVQRLPIPCAVDWTNMKTAAVNEDEIMYKYGNRYFKLLETDEDPETELTIPKTKLLKNSHPKHTYYVEPIPRQHLSHYIKMFYWQSYKLEIISQDEFFKGIDIALKYDELYKKCINDLERFELYWKTLKDAILYKYKEKYFSDNEELYQQFEDNFLQCPPEYFKEDSNYKRKYDQVDFNLSKLPQYITNDYFEITTKELWEQQDSCDPKDWKYDSNVHEKLPHELYLDTEKRMLYNLQEEQWDKKTFSEIFEASANKDMWTQYPDFDNFFKYKPKKIIRNESLLQGHWFKLPPGWSLIDISPVIEETKWGGKLWRDARPFEWGVHNDNKGDNKEFEVIYERALKDYLKNACPQRILKLYGEMGADIENYKINVLEECGQFRRWYGEENYNDIYSNDYILRKKENGEVITEEELKTFFNAAVIHKLNEDAEYGFLKLLCSYWNICHLDENGKINKGIDSWWWFASNYLWANFPPLYWGYMDLLNELQIKYVPLFY